MIKSFIRSKVTTYSLILIITMIIGSYFRLYPLRNFSHDDSSRKATLIVLSRLKNQVDQQIDSSYPELDVKQKRSLKKKMFHDLLRDESAKVTESIQKVTKNIEESSPKRRISPYLLAADSFHFFQLTQNLMETGAISDTIKGSKYLNKLMFAPKGHLEPVTLHPHIGLWIHRVHKWINPKTDLMYSVSFTPLVLTGLSLAIFVWICYLCKITFTSTFVGAIFFVCSPIFVKRSAFGWYDNDPYNALFPLLILAASYAALKSMDRLKPVVVFSLVIALLMLLYAMFWQGWMLMLIVLLISGFIIVVYTKLANGNSTIIRNQILFFGLTALFSFLVIGIKFGPGEFFVIFQEGYKALKNFITPQLSVWPDLYISVGELHKATLREVIELTGGLIFFTVSIFGLITGIFCMFKKKPRIHPGFFLILSVFFLFAIFITLGAQRFAMLCLIPMALLFVVGLDQCIIILQTFLSKFLNDKYQLPASFVIKGTLGLLILIPLITLHRTMPTLLNPIYNDTWNMALTKIRDETPQESIVNTWWPPGHFIKATANRRVTFDGATINHPQAYWLTRVYLSQSEKEALGLLRMLNNSANDAAEYLQEIGFSTSSSVGILRTIASLDKRQARLLLSTKLKSEEQINHLLKLTHTTPPPSYLFIYNELVEKNIQLAFIGKWNFKTIENINNDPQLIEKVPDRNSPKYIQFLWQLAGGPFKYNDPLTEITRKNNLVLFDGNVKVDLKTKSCYIDSPKFGKGIPQSIFYAEGSKVIEKEFSEGKLPYSVIMYQDGPQYHVVLLDRYLANSMLMRLYYFGDRSMRYFKTFAEESDLSKRTDIRIFEVDWQSYARDLGDN